MKVNADVAVLADDLAQEGEMRDRILDPCLVFYRARVAAVQARGAGLEGGKLCPTSVLVRRRCNQ